MENKHGFLKKFITFVILLFMCLVLVQRLSPSNFTFNPKKKMEKVIEEEEFIRGFSNDEFQIYYIKSESTLEPYVFVKKMGIWALDYPNMNNIYGITKGKNHIYYYGEFALDGMYDFVESPQGEKIYSDKKEVFDMETNVFQIPYYSDDNTTYKFGDNKNIMNEEKLFLDGEVVMYKKKDEGHVEIVKSIKEMRENHTQLWTLIGKTIESADKTEEIPDGRTYTFEDGDEDFTQWVIFINYDTGHYINIGKDKKAFDWSGGVYYDIDLKGQHADTISIGIRDYTGIGSPLKKGKESHVYKVSIPEGLREYYEGL